MGEFAQNLDTHNSVEPDDARGGFEPVPADELFAVHWAYMQGRASKGALATWAALREVLAAGNAVERQSRRDRTRRRRPAFTVRRVADLRGVEEGRARREIAELARAGLVLWSETRTAFPSAKSSVPDGEQAMFRAALSRTGRSSRLVPVSRRLLRHLARGPRASVFAAALAVTMRCAYWRAGTLSLSGSLTAAFVESVFALPASTWRSAAAELELTGLFTREQYRSARRRYAHGVIIHLSPAWYGSARQSGGTGAVPSAKSGGNSLNQKRTPTEYVSKDQKRAPAALPPGVSRSNPDQTPPTLRNVRSEDLYEPLRLRALWAEAARRGLAKDSEHGWLEFAALAEHARRVTRERGGAPCALFASNLAKGRWRFIANADEEAARARSRAVFDRAAPSRGPEIQPVAAVLGAQMTRAKAHFDSALAFRRSLAAAVAANAADFPPAARAELETLAYAEANLLARRGQAVRGPAELDALVARCARGLGFGGSDSSGQSVTADLLGNLQLSGQMLGAGLVAASSA